MAGHVLTLSILLTFGMIFIVMYFISQSGPGGSGLSYSTLRKAFSGSNYTVRNVGKRVKPTIEIFSRKHNLPIYFEEKRVLDLRGRYLEVNASFNLDLPDFEIRRSTDITQIVYSSEYVPQELTNINILTDNISQTSMWLNVSPLIKFLQYFLPFQSKYEVFRVRGGRVQFKFFIQNNVDEAKEATLMIASFYNDMVRLLGDKKARRSIRISKKLVTYHCQSCGQTLDFGADKCRYCQSTMMKCVICYQMLESEVSMMNCCGSYIHFAHKDDINNKCPYCRQEDVDLIKVVA